MSTEKKTPEMKHVKTDDTSAENPKPSSEKEHKEDEDKEIGGFKDAGLPEPTRFGDWEVKGRCSDF